MEDKIIETKIKSYFYQDYRRFGTEKSFLPKSFVDVEFVKTLLTVQENKCYICKEPVLIIYKKGCKNQFVLDRINNNNMHVKGNVLIACMFCNCYIYNRQVECKYKCCANKSRSSRKKANVPETEIEDLMNGCNKLINNGCKYYEPVIETTITDITDNTKTNKLKVKTHIETFVWFNSAYKLYGTNPCYKSNNVVLIECNIIDTHKSRSITFTSYAEAYDFFKQIYIL